MCKAEAWLQNAAFKKNLTPSAQGDTIEYDLGLTICLSFKLQFPRVQNSARLS